MKKLLAVAIIALVSGAAQAAQPLIEVTGINPFGKTDVKPVEFYGKDTKEVFAALPVDEDFNDGDFYRSITILSKGWWVVFSCYKEYVNPISNLLKDDYMCGLYAGKNDPDAGDIGETVLADLGDFGGGDLKASGINPWGNPDGVILSAYGKQTNKIDQAINSEMSISSKAYTFSITCEQEYTKPFSGDIGSDYECRFNLKKN